MTQEQAIKAWPMVRAFAEGKQIEFLDDALGWITTNHPDFDRISYLRLSKTVMKNETHGTNQTLPSIRSSDLLAEMVEMSDDDLYSLIRDALEKRKVKYYKDAADAFGWPTWTARLAVMRQICCS